jgi:hypothetical protein
MKEIKIFRIRYYDDNTDYFFKGIEELRDFAIIRKAVRDVVINLD